MFPTELNIAISGPLTPPYVFSTHERARQRRYVARGYTRNHRHLACFTWRSNLFSSASHKIFALRKQDT